MDKRRKEIVDIVNQTGSVTFQQLREAFPNISDVTLRKDLSYLDSTMQLVRTHGGAKSLPAAIGMIDNFYTRVSVNTEAKNHIAQGALTLLQPNLSIYLAPGTTCLALAKVLPDIRMQVFTDGMATAIELAKYTNIETTVFGGEIDSNALRACSPLTFSTLQTMRFDYAIFSADCYLPDQGFVICDQYSWNLQKILRERSDKLVILLDSTKLTPIRGARLLPSDLVDIVVTDGNFDSNTIQNMEKSKIRVL